MKTIITTLFLIAANAAFSQTILQQIPIVTDDPYLVKVWAYNGNTDTWGWYEVTETQGKHPHQWYFGEVSLRVERYDVLDVLLIRGFDDCADTTTVKIYGAFEKMKIKDKEDLRRQIKVDGGSYEFGTKIVRPKQ